MEMTSGTETGSKFDRLHEQMQRYASVERLVILRNLGYGGAAINLLILVGLVQVGAPNLALKIAVLATSMSLPSWLLIGATYEMYILLGKRSYPHLRSRFATRFTAAVANVGGITLFIGTASLIWHLMPEAAGVFVMASLIAIVLCGTFYWSVARWWFSLDGLGLSASKKDP